MKIVGERSASGLRLRGVLNSSHAEAMQPRPACATFSEDEDMKLLNLVGWSSMAIIPKARQTKPTGVIINEHTLTAAQTRLHVETLNRWFDFIHYDDLLDRLSRPRSRPFCLLTFDDGKRSNATITAPELERLGAPAVFYVPTRFLTDGFPLWFDRSGAIRRALRSEERRV